MGLKMRTRRWISRCSGVSGRRSFGTRSVNQAREGDGLNVISPACPSTPGWGAANRHPRIPDGTPLSRTMRDPSPLRSSLMGTVSVWLASWEYECCGPQRKVGDQVSVDVVESEGRLSETRHQVTDDPPARTISGRIEAIFWHPYIYEREGERAWRVTGHGPSERIYDTDKSPTQIERDLRNDALRERLRAHKETLSDRPTTTDGKPVWVAYAPSLNEPPSPPDDGYDLEFVLALTE